MYREGEDSQTLEERVKEDRERENRIKFHMIKLAWPRIMDILKERVYERDYKTFLYSLEPTMMCEGKLWIGTERFFNRRIEIIYGKTIESIIKNLVHIDVLIEFYELE